MNLKLEKKQTATPQRKPESYIALIDNIRETLSQIPAKVLMDIFILYEHISSLDPCSEPLKNATGLLLGLKRIWEGIPAQEN